MCSEKNKTRQREGEQGRIQILNEASESLTEKVTFGQILEEGEGVSNADT